MKKEDYQPPSDPEKRERVAAVYRGLGLCPPWELNPEQRQEVERGQLEILARWEKPFSQTN